MYAVVSSGGKQYRVEAGTTLTLERVDGEPGTSVTLDRVLLIADGDEVTVGTPTVAGASVSATVLGEALGPKLVIFKFKQKVKYRRRTGHRQHMTRLRIDAINPTGEARRAAPAKVAATAKVAAVAEADAPSTTGAPPKARTRAQPKAKAEVGGAAQAAEAGSAPTPRPRTTRNRAAKAAQPAEASTEKPKPRRTAKPKAKE